MHAHACLQVWVCMDIYMCVCAYQISQMQWVLIFHNTGGSWISLCLGVLPWKWNRCKQPRERTERQWDCFPALLKGWGFLWRLEPCGEPCALVISYRLSRQMEAVGCKRMDVGWTWTFMPANLLLAYSSVDKMLYKAFICSFIVIEIFDIIRRNPC